MVIMVQIERFTGISSWRSAGNAINFRGTSPKEILSAVYGDLAEDLVVEEVRSLAHRLYQYNILSAPTRDACTTSQYLLKEIEKKSEEEIQFFLNEVIKLGGKTAIRRKIEEAISERTTEEIPLSSVSVSGPAQLNLSDRDEISDLVRNSSSSENDGNPEVPIRDETTGCNFRQVISTMKWLVLLVLVLFLVVVVSKNTTGVHHALQPKYETLDKIVSSVSWKSNETDSNLSIIDVTPDKGTGVDDSVNEVSDRNSSASGNGTLTTVAPVKSRNGRRYKNNTTLTYGNTTTNQKPELDEVEKLETVFEPSMGRIMLIDNVKNTRYFQQTICDDKPFKTLNFTLDKAYQDKDLNPICFEKVTGLEISGALSLDNFYNLLTNFPNLQYLSISGKTVCEGIEEGMDSLESDANALEGIKLSNLKFLKLSDLPECSPLYSFLTQYVEMPNVHTLVVESVFISISNSDIIDKLFQRVGNLENFKFIGNLCSNCELFSIQMWSLLKVLHFEVKVPSNNNALKSFKKILQVAKDLRYISSNVQIPSQKNMKYLKPFGNLRYLKITNVLRDSTLSFSARFFSVFPFLSESYITLLFNDNSICKTEELPVKLTSLQRYIGESLINKFSLSANCKIEAVKGWQLPCREYTFDHDVITSMRTMTLIKCSNCISGGCKR